MAAAADIHEGVKKHFGDASANELERLVLIKYRATEYDGVLQPVHNKSFVEMLPQGSVFLLAALLQHAGSPQASGANSNDLLRANTSAAVRALTGLNSWSTAVATSTFGQRLLQVPEAEFKLLAGPGGRDYTALRFLAEALNKNMSASEVARFLQEEAEGQQCLETFRTSPTFGAVIMYASYSVFDDIGDWLGEAWNWLTGAAQWVKDAVDQFGKWASKQARAVVDSVFCKFENVTKIMEGIPCVGLVVAGIYAMAGKSDEAYATLAINMNAIVTLVGAGVGFVLGGPAGGMAGGALGKTVGLLIQEAIAQAIKDPKLRAEVGDISAAHFFVEVALGAVYGAAAGIGEVLGAEVGLNAIGVFLSSVGLAGLLSRIPHYFSNAARDENKDHKESSSGGAGACWISSDDLHLPFVRRQNDIGLPI